VFEWDEGKVLKLFNAGFAPDLVEREARNTEAVHKAGLPAPAVEGVVEVDGRLGIVFERVQGPSISKVMQKAPWKLAGAARTMAELHANMHSCELPELPSRVERLERLIRATSTLSASTKEAVLEVLHQLPDGNAVCHGDLWPDNVIMSPRGPVIIDWFGAARGNPLADVARTWLLNRLAYMRMGIPERWIVNSMRALFHSVYLRRYLQLMPGSREQIAEWLLPVAAARLEEKVAGEEPRFVGLIERLLSRRSNGAMH
jgi:uncharacterized protein (TIGR02172 family)